MLTKEEILENLHRHRLTPETSARDHFINLQKLLAIEIEGKRLIYLDTKYWIILRDAQMGKPRKEIHVNILNRLRYLVHEGHALCPISDTAYVESMQQTDVTTRMATAALMDDLSSGVAMVTEEDRVRIELLNFVSSPNADICETSSLLWVRSGFVLGESVPYSKNLDFDSNKILQKSFIDMMWGQTIYDLAGQNGNSEMISIQESAQRIDKNIIRYAAQIRSFEQAKRAEFSGCAKQFTTELASAALVENGYNNATTEEVERFKEVIQRAIYNTLRLRPKIISKKVPTLFIHAMCHAAFRWNKGRKFDSHWQLDIHHACAGLAYHDVMFTEKPLRILLQAGNMKLDQEFKTLIFSEDEALLEYLAMKF